MAKGKVREDGLKCNCTVCGSRFRIKVDREGNVNNDARYCVFCRALLEDSEKIGVQETGL